MGSLTVVYLQVVVGMSPMAAGAVVAIGPLMSMPFAPLSGAELVGGLQVPEIERMF